MSSPRDLLAAVLRGDPHAWRACERQGDGAFDTMADAHGVLPLIADRIEAAGADRQTVERLRAEVRRRLAADLVGEHELRRLLAALQKASVKALLMKGADLAYSAYDRPDLRCRTDTDLLIDSRARPAAATVLAALGYERVPQSGGDLLMYQEPFRLIRDGGVAHVVDLHWRVCNPQRFAATFTFEELDRDAEPRPRLAPGARGLSRVHGLTLACVHRVAHHFDHDRLIWLYDIHVGAARMTPVDWDRFVTLAADRAIRGLCARGLEASRRALGTPVPPDVIARLDADGLDEDDAAFSDARAVHARRIWSDMRHIDNWSDRLSLARQHLFPSSTYMRTVYAPSSGAPLWVLYAQRIARGSRRWLVKS